MSTEEEFSVYLLLKSSQSSECVFCCEEQVCYDSGLSYSEEGKQTLWGMCLQHTGPDLVALVEAKF